MLNLFEAKPGTVSKLPEPDFQTARKLATDLLGGEYFRCFGVFRQSPEPAALQLLAALSGTALMAEGGDYAVRVGDEERAVLGFDLVRGKPDSEGTVYDRPNGKGVKDRAAVADKSFAYVPLDDDIEVDIGAARSLSVGPGSILLMESGMDHTVHVPSWLSSVELVLSEAPDSPRDAWIEYLNAQQNPTL